MSIFGNCGSLKLPSLLCHIAREYVIKHVILHKLIQSDFNDRWTLKILFSSFMLCGFHECWRFIADAAYFNMNTSSVDSPILLLGQFIVKGLHTYIDIYRYRHIYIYIQERVGSEISFTRNGKRQFVPRAEVFPILSLLFIISMQKLIPHARFIRKNYIYLILQIWDTISLNLPFKIA